MGLCSPCGLRIPRIRGIEAPPFPSRSPRGRFQKDRQNEGRAALLPLFFLCVFLPGSKLPGVATHKKRHRCCDALIAGVLLSGKRDSNPRPSAWEADALPTELFPQKHCKCRNFLSLFKDFLFQMSDFS